MGTRELALERVQALLKVDSGSGSLHYHLCRVIRKVVDEKPDDALASLEALSRHLKQSSAHAPRAPDERVPSVADPEAEKAKLQWCSDVLKLVAPSKGPSPPPTVVRNFTEDAAIFHWAGVGFGKLESFQIQTSLVRLAADYPTLTDLRFWGKILGKGADYYIAEGTFPESATPATKPGPNDPEFAVEQRGVGTNEKDYWVTTNPLSPWIRLPCARSEQLMVARQVKHILTGDLDSEVLTMPWFPGKEKHLLRCQIARISAATTLAVAGWFEVDGGEGDGSGKLIVSEGALDAFPSTEELESQEKWVHCRNEILFNGKTAWPTPDDYLEDQAAERELAEHNGEYNLAAPILREIRADKRQSIFHEFPNKPEGGEGDDGETSPGWSIKTFGDISVYDFGDDKPRSNRVTAVRSLLWPGAITAAQGTKFASLYVGYGFKCGTFVPPLETGEPASGTNAFWPLCPADIMDEPVDHDEADEPHPLEDEADSDGRESMDQEEEA